MSEENYWELDDAIALCKQIESFSPRFGCHVGLTGGVLYREGARKDLDLILYRIRQCPAVDFDGLFSAMSDIGIEKQSGFGFCHKAIFEGKRIDFLCPEEDMGEYEPEQPAASNQPIDLLF